MSSQGVLTEKQLRVYNLLKEGYNQTQIAKMLKKSHNTISDSVKLIKKKGYDTNFDQNAKEMSVLEVVKPVLPTF